MTVRITGQTQVKSQTLVNFPPQPALNLNFTQGYANGLNPLPSTVTFTRADAAAVATQVGPNGLLRLAAHNTIRYSQQFDNAYWSVQRGSVTADNQIAPDGTLTADRINATSTSSAGFYLWNPGLLAPITSGAVTTLSCYGKVGTRPQFYLQGMDTTLNNGVYAVFDLTTIKFITSSTFGTGWTIVGAPIIVNVGSGWFRLSISFQTSATLCNAVVLPSITSVSDTSCVSGVDYGYVWGMQVEQNLTPSYYVPTTSAAVYANTPRFDYSPVTTEPLGLLIEESRTNYLWYSNNFVTGGGSTGITITQNSTEVRAPDGSNTASKLVLDTSSLHYQFGRGSSAPTGAQVLSIYVRPSGYDYYLLKATDSNGRYAVLFNIATGAYVNAYNVGTNSNRAYFPAVNCGNGWFRLSITVNTGNSQIGGFPVPTSNPSLNGDLDLVDAGNGTSGCFQWGAQVELGSFATSLIPTPSGANVTRALDLAKMTGANFSSWYTQTGGTFLTVSDTVDPRTSGSPQFFGTPHPLAVYANSNNFYDIRSAATTGSVGMSTGQESATSSDFLFTYNGLAANSQVRQALAIRTNDVAFTYNGGSVSTDTSFALPSSMITMNIGSNRIDGGQMNGHVAKLQYWPARFTDAQLQLITKG